MDCESRRKRECSPEDVRLFDVIPLAERCTLRRELDEIRCGCYLTLQESCLYGCERQTRGRDPGKRDSFLVSKDAGHTTKHKHPPTEAGFRRKWSPGESPGFFYSEEEHHVARHGSH